MKHRRTVGARIVADAPAAPRAAESFANAALRNRQLADVLSGHRWRLLTVTPLEDWDEAAGRFVTPEYEAVLYDYSREAVIRARGPVNGRGPLQVRMDYEQPVPSREEFEAAAALVARDPVWGPLLSSGQVRPYEPMPPVLEPDGGRSVPRTLYVGLVSRPHKFNRIVAVNMAEGRVAREPVTPSRSLAVTTVCGGPEADCFRTRKGVHGSALISWPAADPVWRFRAIRPSASSGTNASGIELQDVRYRGVRVLKQAHVPILNVQYDEDICGPFRDWLWEETCFEAVGNDIPRAPGFRQCTEPPQTMFESGNDGGNFVGVAVYDASDGALVLVSQCAAGWYRYISEWRFYPDGRILPRFKFTTTDSSCTCNTHHHHAYWRLDFDVVEAHNILDQQVGGVWQPIRKELSVRRQEGQELLWRVRHPKTGAAYELIPGATDGVGDDFSGDDQYVLRRSSNQIDDHHTLISLRAEADLARFVGKQSVYREDLVVWYAAHFRHAILEEGGAQTEQIGPTLQPVNWPGA